MGQQYLIDSNTVINFLSGKLPQQSLDNINQDDTFTPPSLTVHICSQ